MAIAAELTPTHISNCMQQCVAVMLQCCAVPVPEPTAPGPLAEDDPEPAAASAATVPAASNLEIPADANGHEPHAEEHNSAAMEDVDMQPETKVTRSAAEAMAPFVQLPPPTSGETDNAADNNLTDGEGEPSPQQDDDTTYTANVGHNAENDDDQKMSTEDEPISQAMSTMRLEARLI